jgi:hypothetical protein
MCSKKCTISSCSQFSCFSSDRSHLYLDRFLCTCYSLGRSHAGFCSQKSYSNSHIHVAQCVLQMPGRPRQAGFCYRVLPNRLQSVLVLWPLIVASDSSVRGVTDSCLYSWQCAQWVLVAYVHGVPLRTVSAHNTFHYCMHSGNFIFNFLKGQYLSNTFIHPKK